MSIVPIKMGLPATVDVEVDIGRARVLVDCGRFCAVPRAGAGGADPEAKDTETRLNPSETFVTDSRMNG
jgi:hypothetical protein